MDSSCTRDSPVAIDQKYPSDKGQFTWGELRCLARCLGFHDSLFKRYVPKEYRKAEGLPDHILLYLIDLKTFDAGIHRTANMQSAEYNNKVLRKSVQMLRAREISFPELRDVRVAFSFYESHDMTGIKAEKQVLLQALKLCGRVASPMYLMSEVRRIKDVLLPGNLQLYEFLDLLKICHRSDDEKFAANCCLRVAPGNNETYSMVDFEELFTTEDQRRLALLDKEFQLAIFRPHKDPPLLFRRPMQPTSVSGDTRRKMVKNLNIR